MREPYRFTGWDDFKFTLAGLVAILGVLILPVLFLYLIFSAL